MLTHLIYGMILKMVLLKPVMKCEEKRKLGRAIEIYGGKTKR